SRGCAAGPGTDGGLRDPPPRATTLPAGGSPPAPAAPADTPPQCSSRGGAPAGGGRRTRARGGVAAGEGRLVPRGLSPGAPGEWSAQIGHIVPAPQTTRNHPDGCPPSYDPEAIQPPIRNRLP